MWVKNTSSSLDQGNSVFAQFRATEKENPYWYFAPDGQRIEFIPVADEILIEFKPEAESSVKLRALSQLKVNEKKDTATNVLFKTTQKENLIWPRHTISSIFGDVSPNEIHLPSPELYCLRACISKHKSLKSRARGATSMTIWMVQSRGGEGIVETALRKQIQQEE